jgi:CheY-like chemotaxis protein
MWHVSSTSLALAILEFDPSLNRAGGDHNDAYLEIVTYCERIVTELQLPVAVMVGSLCIMHSLLQDSATGQDWGWHLALTVSISIACKLFFDEGVYVDDLRPMSDLYSLEILKAAERAAFEHLLAMGGLSDTIKRLELFRAAMLSTLLHQPTLHEHIYYEPDELDATTPMIRALVLEDDPLAATAHRDMLWLLAPDADVTLCNTQEEAMAHLAATRRKPNLLLVDLCLDEKHTGHLPFLKIVAGGGGATFVEAMRDIEDEAQPALSDGRALVIALSSEALNRAQECSLLHRGVHGVVQKPLTTATLRCAVGMVWE